MATKGYLLITDITGYTSFLTGHELDHAQHIIEGLMNCQLDALTSPVQISNFQGDAILCHVPEDHLDSAASLIDRARNIYSAFTAKVAEMHIDPPCKCKACANIDDLDLKIFVHFGEYLVKKLGERDELMGSDVILVHRMMKNSVVPDTGIKSYLLMTDSAFNKLSDPSSQASFVTHEEAYDHIGKVQMHVADLNNW
ncbi:MAG TPA: DUF2652 domain-containing protein [Mariprofundaceae bacterium]|nr:DUF2652 domain-containing protein [Mariprofundaceae bacterium]